MGWGFENEPVSTSPFSFVDVDTTSYNTPPTSNNMSGNDRELKTFVDDGFDVASFTSSQLSGSYTGAEKKTHGVNFPSCASTRKVTNEKMQSYTASASAHPFSPPKWPGATENSYVRLNQDRPFQAPSPVHHREMHGLDQGDYGNFHAMNAVPVGIPTNQMTSEVRDLPAASKRTYTCGDICAGAGGMGMVGKGLAGSDTRVPYDIDSIPHNPDGLDMGTPMPMDGFSARHPVDHSHREGQTGKQYDWGTTPEGEYIAAKEHSDGTLSGRSSSVIIDPSDENDFTSGLGPSIRQGQRSQTWPKCVDQGWGSAHSSARSAIHSREASSELSTHDNGWIPPYSGACNSGWGRQAFQYIPKPDPARNLARANGWSSIHSRQTSAHDGGWNSTQSGGLDWDDLRQTCRDVHSQGDEAAWAAGKSPSAYYDTDEAHNNESILQDQIIYLNQRLNQQEAAVAHYAEMAAQNGAAMVSGTNKATSAPQHTSDELEFLRNCISNVSLSADDRYKAVGILTTLQGANMKLVSPPVPEPATVSNNHELNSAMARIETQMAIMSRDILKEKTYNKFKRMQDDSDRLACIESKLSSLDVAQKDHLKMVIGNAALEIDRLSSRVSKLKEFGRDGTPSSDIQNHVRELSGRVQQLQTYVESCWESQNEDLEMLRSQMAAVEGDIKNLRLNKNRNKGTAILPKDVGIEGLDLEEAVWTPDEDTKLTAMKAEGKTWKEIGSQLGRSKAALQKRWKGINGVESTDQPLHQKTRNVTPASQGSPSITNDTSYVKRNGEWNFPPSEIGFGWNIENDVVPHFGTESASSSPQIAPSRGRHARPNTPASQRSYYSKPGNGLSTSLFD